VIARIFLSKLVPNLREHGVRKNIIRKPIFGWDSGGETLGGKTPLIENRGSTLRFAGKAADAAVVEDPVKWEN
jgi:hypothetical protein